MGDFPSYSAGFAPIVALRCEVGAKPSWWGAGLPATVLQQSCTPAPSLLRNRRSDPAFRDNPAAPTDDCHVRPLWPALRDNPARPRTIRHERLPRLPTQPGLTFREQRPLRPPGPLESPHVIDRPPLPPGPFLVVGLARSGIAAAKALRARGGEVAGCDAGPVADAARAELEAAGIPVHAPAEGVELLASTSTVVKSPGVPQQAPVVATARRQGLRVVGELEVGWRLLPNEFVAVTGSNGKTTTVEAIGHVHRTAGRPVVVAGNVGTALTTLPGTLAP